MSDRAKLGILWAITIVVVIVAYIVCDSNGSGSNGHSVVVKLGSGIKEAIHGEYEDKEIKVVGIKNMFLDGRDREVINEVIKSLADNEYFEIADTVYRTRLVFSGISVTLYLEAKYKELNMSDTLGIKNSSEMTELEFWEHVTDEIQKEYVYEHTGKVSLEDVIANKRGQCYSYAEMLYIVGKEHGKDIRMVVNSVHAWNKVIIDGEEREVDVTYGMER